MKRSAFVCVTGMLVLAFAAAGIRAQSPGRALAGALGIEQAEWRAMTKEAKRQLIRELSKAERQALRSAMGFEEDRATKPSAAAREERRERLKSLSATEQEELRQFFWGPEAPIRTLRGEARKAAKQDLTMVQRRYVRGLDKAQRQGRRQARKARRDAGIPIRRETPLQVLPSRAVGTIQYDNNLAMGRLATGGLKGNRFDTALTAMGGGPSPVIASGEITQVSAILSLDTTSAGGKSTTAPASLMVLGPGTTTGMAVPLATVTNTDGATQVVTFGTPVNYTGPSFIVAFRDDSATTTTTTTTTSTSTGTFTTITTTTTTSMGATSMMTTMTFTATGTTITTTTVTNNVNRFVPATSTGTVGGQAFHGVAINGTNVADVAGINFLVRARGNIVVPVELMGFSIE